MSELVEECYNVSHVTQDMSALEAFNENNCNCSWCCFRDW